MAQDQMEGEKLVARSAEPIQISSLKVKPIPSVDEVAKVRVLHGANEYIETSGQTVSQIRKRLRDVLNISKEAMAYVNNQLVDEETVLQKGDCLEFYKNVGTKG